MPSFLSPKPRSFLQPAAEAVLVPEPNWFPSYVRKLVRRILYQNPMKHEVDVTESILQGVDQIRKIAVKPLNRNDFDQRTFWKVKPVPHSSPNPVQTSTQVINLQQQPSNLHQNPQRGAPEEEGMGGKNVLVVEDVIV
ncbi:hypothetical protein KSP39_PZI020876 [Platanthera zijinensis]|uniref:Uncharacterized protein n=1 Tax=Platanthera zijinensis TaxID=2320716 RepID=A0AAP0B0F8_9ASPA